MEEFELPSWASFDVEMASLLDSIMPLYRKLHSLVKRRLEEFYQLEEEKEEDAQKTIPAHLLGMRFRLENRGKTQVVKGWEGLGG